jgi:hypothetical protein
LYSNSMPSLLSRLRRRTVSSETTHPPTTTTTPNQSQPLPGLPLFTLLPQVPIPVDRKILSNPDSLLTSFAEEPTEQVVAHAGVVGLKPSRRKRSTDAFRRASWKTGSSSPPEGDGSGQSPELPTAAAKGGSSRFINRLSSPGEWSTFGRQRERVSVGLGDFGEAEPRPRQESDEDEVESGEARSASLDTPSRVDIDVNSSSPSSTDTSKSIKHINKAKTPESHSLRFFTLARESPETFGHRTPGGTAESQSPGGLFNSGVGLGLVGRAGQPEECPSGRRKSSSGAGQGGSTQSSPTTETKRTLSRENLQQRTYPPHRRTVASHILEPLWPNGTSSSLPYTSGKPKAHPNRPRAQHIFAASRSSSSSSDERRGQGGEKGRERRMSADWNAQQATEEVGWPGLVSREILRMALSLEDRAHSGSSSVTNKRAGRRAGHVAEDIPILGDAIFVSPSHPPLTSKRPFFFFIVWMRY